MQLSCIALSFDTFPKRNQSSFIQLIFWGSEWFMFVGTEPFLWLLFLQRWLPVSIADARFTALFLFCCLLRWREFPPPPPEFWAICLTLPVSSEVVWAEFKQVVPSGCCHRGWDHTFILSPWWICLTLSNSSWLWSHIMKSLKIESGREQRGALIIYWLGRIHTFCKDTSFVVFWSIQFSLSQI